MLEISAEREKRKNSLKPGHSITEKMNTIRQGPGNRLGGRAISYLLKEKSEYGILFQPAVFVIFNKVDGNDWTPCDVAEMYFFKKNYRIVTEKN